MMQDIQNTPARVLVTGGAGFIGSHLTDALLQKGYFVRVLDDFSTGRRENLAQAFTRPLFELMEGDICSLDTCMQACENIEIVFHQAALGSVPRSIENPIKTNAVNIDGMLNMLIASRENSVKKFIYASSSSVYGDNSDPIKTEGREGIPLSPYAATKRLSEFYANNFYQLYGLKTVGLRYFNIFGERQRMDSEYAAVIPRFIHAAFQDEQAVIYGDGLQSRDFTYVGNAVYANLNAMLLEQEVYGSVFNIGCATKTTILELAEKIYSMAGKQTSYSFLPERKGDVRQSIARIDTARQQLGYSPVYSLDAGLAKTVLLTRQSFIKIQNNV